MAKRLKNPVTETKPEAPDKALEHFRSRLMHEADCWDVHATQQLEDRGFVLLDARPPEAYAKGHLPGAINLFHGNVNKERLSEYPMDTLFVTYCAGPHCNASTRAAIRLSELGRPVKEMIGGTEGWIDDGHELVRS